MTQFYDPDDPYGQRPPINWTQRLGIRPDYVPASQQPPPGFSPFRRQLNAPPPQLTPEQQQRLDQRMAQVQQWQSQHPTLTPEQQQFLDQRLAQIQRWQAPQDPITAPVTAAPATPSPALTPEQQAQLTQRVAQIQERWPNWNPGSPVPARTDQVFDDGPMDVGRQGWQPGDGQPPWAHGNGHIPPGHMRPGWKPDDDDSERVNRVPPGIAPIPQTPSLISPIPPSIVQSPPAFSPAPPVAAPVQPAVRQDWPTDIGHSGQIPTGLVPTSWADKDYAPTPGATRNPFGGMTPGPMTLRDAASPDLHGLALDSRLRQYRDNQDPGWQQRLSTAQANYSADGSRPTPPRQTPSIIPDRPTNTPGSGVPNFGASPRTRPSNLDDDQDTQQRSTY